MRRQLARIAFRHLQRHPWQLGLAVLGIALGVAVAVSIDLANESARRAFSLATMAVTGRATHQVVGGPSGLPDDFYRVLKMELGVHLAAPVLSGDVVALSKGNPGRVPPAPPGGRAGRSRYSVSIHSPRRRFAPT